MPRIKFMTVPCVVSAVLLAPLVVSAQLGVPITAPVALNGNAATDSGSDHDPQLTTDGAGNWVAVWVSTNDLGGTIGTDQDILAARSTDNGASWSTPQALNSNAAADSRSDRHPHVATDGSGSWVAVWDSDDDLGGTIGTEDDILVARSTDNGATWSVVQALNALAATDSAWDAFPQVTSEGAGNWLAVWHSTENLGETIGTEGDILVARSTDNGASWSIPQALNANAASDSGADWYPQVSTDGYGNWVAVWVSIDDLGGTIGTDYDILVARSTDDGATWSAPQALNTNATSDSGSDYGVRVTTDGTGNWVAVWYSDENVGGSIGADYDILMARSTDNGATWSAARALNANAASDSGDDYRPQSTTDGAGNWVAVWMSVDDLGGTIGIDQDILAARSTDNGASWSTPQALNSNAGSDSEDDWSPQLTTDGAGNWVAVWWSFDDLGGTIGSDPDILVARFALPDCNGNGLGDARDIAEGTSQDCDGNGVPDECQPDADGDAIIDACEGPCGCGATSAVVMSFWVLFAARLARRRRVRADAVGG